MFLFAALQEPLRITVKGQIEFARGQRVKNICIEGPRKLCKPEFVFDGVLEEYGDLVSYSIEYGIDNEAW